MLSNGTPFDVLCRMVYAKDFSGPFIFYNVTDLLRAGFSLNDRLGRQADCPKMPIFDERPRWRFERMPRLADEFDEAAACEFAIDSGKIKRRDLFLLRR